MQRPITYPSSAFCLVQSYHCCIFDNHMLLHGAYVSLNWSLYLWRVAGRVMHVYICMCGYRTILEITPTCANSALPASNVISQMLEFRALLDCWVHKCDCRDKNMKRDHPQSMSVLVIYTLLRFWIACLNFCCTPGICMTSCQHLSNMVMCMCGFVTTIHTECSYASPQVC